MLTGRRHALAVAAALLALAALACGSDAESSSAVSQSNAVSGDLSTIVGDPGRGEKLFRTEACSSCHSTGTDRVVGPGLKEVADRAAARGGDDYLIESIRYSNEFVVEGFSPVMPSFANMDAQKVADLVAYLNTLK